MPKIEALLKAEAKLDLANRKLWKQYARRDEVAEELQAIDERITTALEGPEAEVEAARTLQRRHLTRWVVSDNRGQAHRYELRESGPSNRHWSREAWLREMRWDPPEGWCWTLDYSEAVGSAGGRCRLEGLSHIVNPFSDVQTLETMTHQIQLFSRADALLVKAGWILTDLDNK